MTGKKVTIILGVVGVAFVIGAISIAIPIYQSGFWRGPDAMFGDQHLKTAVSLIELHKIRFGSYPRSLSELKYLERLRVAYMAVNCMDGANWIRLGNESIFQ